MQSYSPLMRGSSILPRARVSYWGQCCGCEDSSESQEASGEEFLPCAEGVCGFSHLKRPCHSFHLLSCFVLFFPHEKNLSFSLCLCLSQQIVAWWKNVCGAFRLVLYLPTAKAHDMIFFPVLCFYTNIVLRCKVVTSLKDKKFVYVDVNVNRELQQILELSSG